MRTAACRLLPAAGFVAALAAPAWAQFSIQQQGALNVLDSQLRAREAMANRQAVGVQNQLSSLDAQIRTEQSLADVRGQAYAPVIPQYVIPQYVIPQYVIPHYQAPPPVSIDAGAFAAIPDDKLAASNQRVREAAANHH